MRTLSLDAKGVPEISQQGKHVGTQDRKGYNAGKIDIAKYTEGSSVARHRSYSFRTLLASLRFVSSNSKNKQRCSPNPKIDVRCALLAGKLTPCLSSWRPAQLDILREAQEEEWQVPIGLHL